MASFKRSLQPRSRRQRIANVSDVKETRIVNVRSRHDPRNKSASPSASETVVGLGSEAYSAAELYASLTGRRTHRAATFDALTQLPRPTVLVTFWNLVSAALLEWVQPLGDGAGTVGLILAETSADLRRQVLAHAERVNAVPDSLPIRADVYPELQIDRITSRYRTVLGNRATVGDLRAAMSVSNSILTLVSHADGVDAKLSDSAVLCPMNDAPRPVGGDPPRCVVTSFCHRRRMPIADALSSHDLLFPESIRTRVLVWGCCFGMNPLPNVDPIWAVMRRLAASPTIEAIITTWELTLAGPATLEPLSISIANGQPLGQALGEFHRLHRVKQLGLRMILLGDPRYRAGPQNDLFTSRQPREDTPSRHHRRRRRPTAADVRMATLRSFFDSLPQLSNAAHAEAAFTARTALRDYIQAARTGMSPEKGADSRGTVMRRSVLAYLKQRDFAHWLEHWLPFARSARAQPRRCTACGAVENVMIYRLAVAGSPARRLGRCPQCGAVNDRPSDWYLAFSVSRNRTMTLEGRLPRRHWMGGVMFSAGMTNTPMVWMDWPTEEDGAPRRIAAIDMQLPPGPLFVTLTVLWGGRVAVLTRLSRGDASATSTYPLPRATI